MKKGRHRRFEEARAMKRSGDVDFDALLDSLRVDENDDDELEASEDEDSWTDDDPGSEWERGR